MRAPIASGAAPLYGSVGVGLPGDLLQTDQASINAILADPL